MAEIKIGYTSKISGQFFEMEVCVDDSWRDMHINKYLPNIDLSKEMQDEMFSEAMCVVQKCRPNKNSYYGRPIKEEY